MSYSIIDYSSDMTMDNLQSMESFLDELNIHADDIVDHQGTQVILEHYSYYHNLVIDAGGLDDFFSHSFDCYWFEDVLKEIE